MTDLLAGVGSRSLTDRFLATRALTESLAAPLTAEDQTVQSMPDVSPTKWHRAHTTWFFETFLLEAQQQGYRPFHPEFGYLFNSYYEGVGARYPRPDRGLHSRPGIADIADYRAYVDGAMESLLEVLPNKAWAGSSSWASTMSSSFLKSSSHGHQARLSLNPLLPAYDDLCLASPATAEAADWSRHSEGTYDIGHVGEGFSFDNEGRAPRATSGGSRSPTGR